MKKLLAIISIFAIILWSGYRFWYMLAMRAAGDVGDPGIIVEIPKGSSTREIADILEEKDVIRSSFAFTRHVLGSGDAARLQAGSFVLRPSMNTAEVAEALATGSGQEAPVTIPEGFTVSDIDLLLAEKGLIQPGELQECAVLCDFSAYAFLPKVAGLAERGGKVEGYLYPDTYFVAGDLDPEAFIERLLSTFEERIIKNLSKELAASTRSLHEIVTMGSLIEEETRTNTERAVVSGILWKRFDEGMGLGVDATVRYILQKPTAALTTADLNTDSAYNLRKYRGLPPGPIANAGIGSIKAALQPQESPYWYYLHGKDGMIRYAVTNEEHNLNKAKYLK